MSREGRKYVVFGVLALLMIALDQWTKGLVRDVLKPLGYAGKSVYGQVVMLRYTENPGVAFGMLRDLQGGRLILGAIATIGFVLVIHYLRITPPERLRLQVALGLIAGGAGNLIDRIRFGRVTDFVVVDLGFWPFSPWPSFNVADAALVVGVGLMLIDMVRPPKEEAVAPTARSVDEG
jgi:signal peptidase II